MAVLKNQRGLSDMEFIYTARQLQVYTIQKCINFPKRYTFYVSQPICQCATKIHEYVKCANSIYPTNQHEVQLRRDYLMRANAELFHLIAQVEVANELFWIGGEKVRHWMDLIEKEMALVKGVLKQDRERYKNLP